MFVDRALTYALKVTSGPMAEPQPLAWIFSDLNISFVITQMIDRFVFGVEYFSAAVVPTLKLSVVFVHF